MENVEGAVELNFRTAVVTRKEDDIAQLVVLNSLLVEGAPQETQNGWPSKDNDFSRVVNRFTRRAIDTDSQPWCDVIDVIEEENERDVDIPVAWTTGGEYELIHPGEKNLDWKNINVGSLIHIHDFRRPITPHQTETQQQEENYQDWSEYCINPEVLDETDIIRVVAEANESRRQNARCHIARIVVKERELLETMETVNPDEGVLLFDGATLEIRDYPPAFRGLKYLSVPDRVIESPKHGIWLLRVRCSQYRTSEDDSMGKIFYVPFNGGLGQYFIPYIFPLNEVDESGLPIKRNRPYGKVTINIGSPYRQHTHAMDEERAEVELGSLRLSTEIDGDSMIGNLGFGGLIYTDFTRVGDMQPYYEKRPTDLPDLPPRLISSSISVPLDDIDALMELKIRLPGF